jgi:hypothetical protein
MDEECRVRVSLAEVINRMNHLNVNEKLHLRITMTFARRIRRKERGKKG